MKYGIHISSLFIRNPFEILLGKIKIAEDTIDGFKKCG